MRVVFVGSAMYLGAAGADILHAMYDKFHPQWGVLYWYGDLINMQGLLQRKGK